MTTRVTSIYFIALIENHIGLLKTRGRKQILLSLPLLQDHIRRAIQKYFILPVGKCYDDWRDDQKNRRESLENFLTRFREQAEQGFQIQKADGSYVSIPWRTYAATVEIDSRIVG